MSLVLGNLNTISKENPAANSGGIPAAMQAVLDKLAEYGVAVVIAPFYDSARETVKTFDLVNGVRYVNTNGAVFDAGANLALTADGVNDEPEMDAAIATPAAFCAIGIGKQTAKKSTDLFYGTLDSTLRVWFKSSLVFQESWLALSGGGSYERVVHEPGYLALGTSGVITYLWNGSNQYGYTGTTAYNNFQGVAQPSIETLGKFRFLNAGWFTYTQGAMDCFIFLSGTPTSIELFRIAEIESGNFYLLLQTAFSWLSLP